VTEDSTAEEADQMLLALAESGEPEFVTEAEFDPAPPQPTLAPGPSAIPPLHLAV
jgi:hypothetical protein